MKGIVLAAIILAATSDDQDKTTVQWTANYTVALNQTQESDKPLLVVIDDPSAPERRAGYASKKPGKDLAELLGNYELCRVDAATDYGKQVAEAFGVEQFPFMAIIDKTGAGVLYQKAGKMDTDQWSEQLATYKNGQIPGTHSVAKANATGNTVAGTTVARKRTSTGRSRRVKAKSTCYT